MAAKASAMNAYTRSSVLPRISGMVRIGSHTLEPEEKDVLERLDVGIDHRIRHPLPHLAALFRKTFDGRCRRIGSAAMGEVRPATCCCDLCLQPFAELNAPPDELFEPLGVEIHVRER